VNIYVGIGIPWLIDTAYNFIAYREPLRIKNAEGLSFSLLVFFCTSVGCIGVLVFRRQTLGAELGGPRHWAWITCVYFMLLWIIFVVLSSLKVSGIIWKDIINVSFLSGPFSYFWDKTWKLPQYAQLSVLVSPSTWWSVTTRSESYCWMAGIDNFDQAGTNGSPPLPFLEE
jgi:hypothetical protein